MDKVTELVLRLGFPNLETAQGRDQLKLVSPRCTTASSSNSGGSPCLCISTFQYANKTWTSEAV